MLMPMSKKTKSGQPLNRATPTPKPPNFQPCFRGRNTNTNHTHSLTISAQSPSNTPSTTSLSILNP